MSPGAELLQLHKELGVVPGGEQTVTCDGLLWEDIVGQYAGISRASVLPRMKLAEAAAGIRFDQDEIFYITPHSELAEPTSRAA